MRETFKIPQLLSITSYVFCLILQLAKKLALLFFCWLSSNCFPSSTSQTRKGHVFTQRRVSLREFYQYNHSCLNTAAHWLTAQLQNSPVWTSPYCFLTHSTGITLLPFITRVLINYSTLENRIGIFFKLILNPTTIFFFFLRWDYFLQLFSKNDWLYWLQWPHSMTVLPLARAMCLAWKYC